MCPVIDDTTQRVILRENIEIKFVHAFNKTFQVQLKLALSRSDTSEFIDTKISRKYISLPSPFLK